MKKRILSALLLSTVGLTALAPVTHGYATTDSDIAKQDQAIAKAQTEKAKAQGQMKDLQSKVDTLKSKQEDAKKQLHEIEQEAKALDQQMKTLNENIADRTSTLEAQARSAQVNTATSSYLTTLLDSESLTDAIQKVAAMATVSSANKQMLEEQEQDQKTLEVKAKDMQKNYAKFMSLSNTLDAQSKELATQQAQLEVATLNYQAMITTAQDKKDKLLAAKAAAEKAAKEAAAKEKANAEQQRKVAEAKAAAEQAAKEAAQSPEVPNLNTPDQGGDKDKPTPPEMGEGTVWDYRSMFLTSDSSYNGYAGGGCTDYVWQYFAAQGVYIPNVMPGNGKDWAYQMPRAPKVVPGVIASFAGGAHGSDPTYGHVAIVTKVHANGSFDVIEGGSSWWGHERTIPNSNGVTFVLP